LLKMVPVVCSFACRTIASSMTLKSSVDNTSPCLNSCCVSKGSKQLFCILTQHLTVVGVALVGRISLVGKSSFAIITIDFISCYGVLNCLEVFKKMMSCDFERIVFSRIYYRANSWAEVDLPDWNLAWLCCFYHICLE
jgi:hypothetical protein